MAKSVVLEGFEEEPQSNGVTKKPRGRPRKEVTEAFKAVEQEAVKAKAKKEVFTEEKIKIEPLVLKELHLRIRGRTPYMQAKFSKKARTILEERHKAGSTSRTKKNRTARDFDDDGEGARYKMPDNSSGIPCSAFRNAMISACRLVGFKMTLAKLSIFVRADGLDVEDGTPLVKLNGDYEITVKPVRNATGVVDLRARPQWKEWSALVRVTYDSKQFDAQDVYNLMHRVGLQVGVGEGRHDSKSSAGIGLGEFDVELA